MVFDPTSVTLSEKQWYAGSALLILLCVVLSVTLSMPMLGLLPFVLVFAIASLADLRIPFYAYLFFIPLSTEFYISTSLATDLPTEPLMWWMLILGILYAITQPQRIEAAYLLHPITLCVLALYAWMWGATIFSLDTFPSVKYALAKTWYLVALYAMPFLALKNRTHFRRAIWLICISLIFTILWVTYRHSQYGFELIKINASVGPFYRNKVTYGGFLACMLPLIGYLILESKGKWLRQLFLIVLALTALMGVWLSGTRAAIGCVLLLPIFYVLIHLRLLRFAIVGALLGAFLLVNGMLRDDAYLVLKPDYHKTVSQQDFTSLMEATLKGRDISSMERLHRWVGAGFMVADRPITGFGPGNFYTYYKAYTLNLFRTYMSKNTERSGIHNYYLMLLIEQGIPALLGYLTLIFWVLLRAEQLYHRLAVAWQKRLLMAVMLCLLSIHVLQVMNDLLETDKIGALFFICTAIVVIIDLRYRNNRLSGVQP